MKNIQRLFVIALGAGLVTFITASRDARASDHQDQFSGPSTQPTNPVVQWNKNLLVIVRTPGVQPATMHATRSFAIMHAAIYDAVNAIERTHKPYLAHLDASQRKASEEAAVDSAAHEVLVALYPTQKAALDSEFLNSLAEIADGPEKFAGIAIGQTVADQILALRSTDGANASPIPYVFGRAPGDYQSTPPNFPAQPQLTQWSRVTPFAIERADQFRPGPPPALTSDTYTAAFIQIKSLGMNNSTTATADQQQIGQFWNGAIQNYWNEIAQTASLAHHLTTAENAVLFAKLNISLADTVIAFYDAKYTYNRWRPVTAIRAADTDGNAETSVDTAWLPEGGKNTAPDPAYPGAHAAISAAAAEVLKSFFKKDDFRFNVTSEVMPGVERSFTKFSAAFDEASFSRVLAGQHFSFDEDAGAGLGTQVADFVDNNFLIKRDKDDVADRDHAPR
jgi:hypothetical protein